MALRFQPYISPETYLKYRDEANQPRTLDKVNTLAETLSQYGNDIRQRKLADRQLERQGLMDKILYNEQAQKQREYDSKYGRTPEPGQMIDTGYDIGKSSFMPGGVGAVQNKTPMDEYINQVRSTGFAGGVRPEAFPYLGSDERKFAYDQMKPKEVTYSQAQYTDPKTGKVRLGRFSSAGEYDIRPGDPLAATKSSDGGGEDASKLRREFIDRPEVKEYQIVSTQVRSMDSMMENALKGNLDNQLALDQALITMYNKLTDPNSVVRESEYARTPENIPVVNRISGAIDKVKAGGAGLTNEDRQALVLGAKIIANERGKTFTQTRKGYLDIAGMTGVDPKLLTATIPEFQPYDTNLKSPTETKNIRGKTYIKVNGEWYEQ